MAYSLYLIYAGRIGSRSEREYIDAERAARQYRRLASSIHDFKFEDDDDFCADEEEVQSCHSNSSYDDSGKVADDEKSGIDQQYYQGKRVVPVP